MDDLPESLKGYFLMAMPGLMDPNFRQTVTCISEHTDQGAVGLVINQVLEGVTGRMVFEELKIDFSGDPETIPLHIGGPVHTNELFVLHGPPLEWGDSLAVADGLALSNSREILEAIAQQQGPAAYLLCLGCAGWAPGQLEWELSQNAWLVCPGKKGIIFDTPIEQRWTTAVKSMGFDPAVLSDTAGHA